MSYSYRDKISFSPNVAFDIDYVNNVADMFPNDNILVEVQNTRGISSQMLRQLNSNVLVRIAGGFDDYRCKNGHQTGNGYVDSVIYTRNESIKILEEIESIESRINPNWSEIQKIIYIYDKLRRSIMYDPKHEKKLSKDIRSLRGLITKNTVCVGYALIFKEFMDRAGIECEYVEGATSKDPKNPGLHGWNIVVIDGKKYPIDLTWDNSRFRAGQSKYYTWLGCEISEFSNSHFPYKNEKTQDYDRTLSRIDPELVKSIIAYNGISNFLDYKSITYCRTRKDSSKFVLAQVGECEIGKVKFYRFYYEEILPDGTSKLPLILYSEANVARLMDNINFNRGGTDEAENIVDNILFSRENIADSIAKKTYYIGHAYKKCSNNKTELISSCSDIEKPENKSKFFSFDTRHIMRSDKSVFIIQQTSKKPFQVNGIDILSYDIFEMVDENGEKVLKKNTVYTERELFNDKRQEVVDEFLSREILDRNATNMGGYIGYYSANGVRIYNPDLVRYFEVSTRLDFDSMDKTAKYNNDKIQIPSFSELKELALKYELYIESGDIFESDMSKYKVRDIKTGEVMYNQELVDKAMFANIWLTAAGVKYYESDARNGERYAFNEPAERLYNMICDLAVNNCRSSGYIDTAEIFRKVVENMPYKYSREILVSLFRTPYQATFINSLFLRSLGISEHSKIPEALYSSEYASELAYGDKSKKRI